MADIFPRIEIIHNTDFRYYEKNTESDLEVILYTEPNVDSIVITNKPEVSIFGLDPYYVSIGKGNKEVYDNLGNNVVSNNDELVVTQPKYIKIFFKHEGTGRVKAVYEYVNPKGKKILLKSEIEFVVYDAFFRNNYKNMWTSFEVENLKVNKKLDITIKTIMEYFDIIHAVKNDIEEITDPLYTKSKFLSLLGQNLGFERIDFSDEDTSLELISNNLYRELLNSLQDLLQIRGTSLSYELFFNALGYDIVLKEFWYDDESRLIEINPIDDTQSTFFAYDETGRPIDEPQIPRKDPRKNSSKDNPYNINSKSNYIRIDLSIKEDENGNPVNEDLISGPAEFNTTKKKVISKYLEFLRPQHLKYLLQVLITKLDPEIIDYLNNDIFNEDHDYVSISRQSRQSPQDQVPPEIIKTGIDMPKALNSKIIELKFNEDVKKIDVENLSNWNVSLNISPYTGFPITLVKRLADKRTVRIYLLNDLTISTIYRIQATNINDLFDNVITPIGGNATFQTQASFSVGLDPSPGQGPKIILCQAINSNTIKIEFDKNIDITTGEIIANYSFTPLLSPSNIIVDNIDNKLIYVTVLSMTHVQLYEVIVSNVEDQWTNLIDEDFDTCEFLGIGSGIIPDTGIPIPPDNAPQNPLLNLDDDTFVENFFDNFENDLISNGASFSAFILNSNIPLDDIISSARRFDTDWYFDQVFLDNDAEPPEVTYWETGTVYAIGDKIQNGEADFYICKIAHTSGSFNTDLSFNKWELYDFENDVIIFWDDNLFMEDEFESSTEINFSDISVPGDLMSSYKFGDKIYFNTLESKFVKKE